MRGPARPEAVVTRAGALGRLGAAVRPRPSRGVQVQAPGRTREHLLVWRGLRAPRSQEEVGRALGPARPGLRRRGLPREAGPGPHPPPPRPASFSYFPYRSRPGQAPHLQLQLLHSGSELALLALQNVPLLQFRLKRYDCA